MKDEDKTKDELRDELTVLHQRIAELKASEIRHKWAERLLQALNQAAVAMEQALTTEEALKAARDGLERRVKERSAELVKSNQQLRREIIERKEVQEELGESREHFQTLFNIMVDPVVIIDGRGEILEVTNSVQELTGFKREELVGKNFLRTNILTAKSKTIAINNLAKRMRGMKIAPYELEVVTKDRKKIAIEVNAAKIMYRTKAAIMVVFRDITERKRAEMVLRQSEQKFRLLAQNTQDIICLHEPDGRYIYVSPSSKRILGYEPEKLVGKDPYELVHPEDREKIQKESYNRVLKGENILISYRIRKKSGEYIWFESTNQVIKDKKGNIIQIVSVSRDITDRKKTEETLLQSEKLRALGEMAGGVAHDFNNLLAIILGNAQLLEKGLKRYKEEEVRKHLKTIAQTTYEGRETVRRLQHFTRREVSTKDLTRIDLNEIVRSAISSTSPRWKDEAEVKGITIRIKEELGKLPPLLGNRSELMEILTNLIFNAVEAMPQGGEITLCTEVKENEAFLHVTDQGKGIPKKIKSKIFDPFFTTKGPKASGLGLSTSYGIVKLHKGKIKVESTKGKGTTFTISLPVPLEVSSEKEKPEEPEKIASQKILVIDDEEGVRDVLGRILQDEGHKVTLTETARKGLAKFSQAHFDLVLTDLGMPEMSGWELAKKIKEVDSNIMVGLITGWAVTASKEKMKEEVDFIISKPFDLTKVVGGVNAALKSKKRWPAPKAN